MIVREALKIIQAADSRAEPHPVLLGCGFTPLHLHTLLRAHLQKALPQRAVSLSHGLFGDLVGTIEAAGRSGAALPRAVAIVLEWSDLDPRLGYRTAGRWSPAEVSDVLNSASARLLQLAAAVENIQRQVPIAISLPSVPLPPIFNAPGWQASAAELVLNEKVAGFASCIAQRSGTAFVNSARLAEESPFFARYDAKSDLLTGFPYKLAHADALAAALTRLLSPGAPKKGIITDLDDTLWDGIVGEVGVDGVGWDFGRHHHIHALYQTVLGALSEQGVLIGVASKNDPLVVEETLRRPDLLLRADRLFPIEVHWDAKSASVDRILKIWNVAADSAIFVDDSPMEIAEVQAAHPGILCLQFPKHDYEASIALLRQLRDLCGRDRISEEDHLRVESIRQAAEFRRMTEGGSVPDSFLEQARATITFDFDSDPGDGRPLDLVNKTNQFNLNGIRRSSADWQASFVHPGTLVIVVTYEDKFGPLGKIAVLRGRQFEDRRLRLDTWVMSCRAFTRRIEHQCLRILFERCGAAEIDFEFAPTVRNGPARDFFAALLGHRPEGAFRLTRDQFASRCPSLYHEVLLRDHRQPEERQERQPLNR